MPITVTELRGSPHRLGAGSVERRYKATGETTDEIAVRDAIATAAGASYDDLPFVDVTDLEKVGEPDLWIGTAQYSSFEFGFDPTETQRFEFDTTGGTQHITQSEATINKYPALAPDFAGAIGVDSDQSVQGVDLVAPVFTFNCNRKMTVAEVTQAFITNVYTLTGKTNSASTTITIAPGVTLVFAIGELLFLGARGSKLSSTHWDINFSFAASPNVTGKTIGGITGINKKGWEYIWVYYEPVADATGKALVQRPRSVNVERVYDSGAMSGLGLS